MSDAIVAEGLVKRFGDAPALDGLDLTVAEGTVLGLLGPNGSGKTTTVKILTTLWRPDAGRARVAGVDVVANPSAVRRRIGLAGQFSAVDYTLTGRENLVLFGRLYRLGHRQAQKRADRLLERFNLAEVGRKPVKTYSGGMIRKLDLAVSLVASPRVLFMDEPTTGLDPAGRLELYDLLEEQVRGGMTLLLTSQYLEEVDRLADSIAVLARGKVIALGTADELKRQVGGDRVEVRLADPSQVAAAIAALRPLAQGEPVVDVTGTVIGVPTGSSTIAAVVRALDGQGIEMQDITIHRPTLDDVFLKLTGASTLGIAAWAGLDAAPADAAADAAPADAAADAAPADAAADAVDPAADTAAIAIPALRRRGVEPIGTRAAEPTPQSAPEPAAGTPEPAAASAAAPTPEPVEGPAVAAAFAAAVRSGQNRAGGAHRAPGPPVEPPVAGEPAASSGSHAAASQAAAVPEPSLPVQDVDPAAPAPDRAGAPESAASGRRRSHRAPGPPADAPAVPPTTANGAHPAVQRPRRPEPELPMSWFRAEPVADHAPNGAHAAGPAHDPEPTDPHGFVLIPAEPGPVAKAEPPPGTGRRRRGTSEQADRRAGR